MSDYLRCIQLGKWEDIVTKIRLEKDSKKRDNLKVELLPTCSMSGEFSYRNDESLLVHSGYMALDCDEIDVQETIRKLSEDDYIFALWMSAGGDGIRIVIKIDPAKHRETFLGAQTYFWEKYDLEVEPDSIAVSKPYFVSYDPNLYWNINCSTFNKTEKEVTLKEITNFVYEPGDFDQVFNGLVSKRAIICSSYQEWLKIGFAFVHQFGENGRSYFHRISELDNKYNYKKCNKQYDYCLKHKSGNVVRISTFYYFCKINNVSIFSERTKTIRRVVINNKKAGLKPEQIIQNLEKYEDIKGADEYVNRLFKTEDLYDDDDDGLLEQLEAFISANYKLRMNSVTGFLEQGYERLSPNDLNSIFISAKKKINRLEYQLMMRLLKSDFIEKYNPFFEFLNSDGVKVTKYAKEQSQFKSPTIDLMASTLITDEPEWVKYFFRKWYVSIVAAMHGLHSPLLLALLGKRHGSGKTYWLTNLLPDYLAEHYFARSGLDKGKDDEIVMTEKILLLDDELDGKNKAEATKIKNITSTDYFYIRRPYGEFNEKIMRIAVLCGTSNTYQWMRDTTGNRRFINVMVKEINQELYNTIDKKEMMMEAYQLYRNGYDWRILGKDIDYLRTNEEEFEMPNKEKELIQRFYEVPEKSCLDYEAMTSTDIVVELEILTRQKLSLVQIGREMARLGFTQRSIRVSSVSCPKKWIVLKIGRSFNQPAGPF